MFITDVLVVNCVNYEKFSAKNKIHTVVSGQTILGISHELDTSELVELLQQSSVEHLTEFRQFEAQQFSSVAPITTTDFQMLYAYKRGEYERCLQLSTNNVRMLIGAEGMPHLSFLVSFPEFIQLMDDDIVSLIGLIWIAYPSISDDASRFDSLAVSQLSLSLYLMTQCQMKLHHPLTSLAQTLDYVEAARQDPLFTLNHLLLKLTERKILLYTTKGRLHHRGSAVNSIK